MKKFRGFTLSEVMIAMAVLGILIAIITPAIVKNRPNSKKMLIKKSYYTAESIVTSLINDERLYPDKTDECYSGIKTNCRWGFDDTSSVNYEGTDYSGDTKFENLFAAKLNVKLADTQNHRYTTSDGVVWDLSGTQGKWTGGKEKVGTFDSHEAGLGIISIDVNGDDEEKACTNNDDCDQYKIQILANGKMRIDPTYNNAVEYVTMNSSITDNEDE